MIDSRIYNSLEPIRNQIKKVWFLSQCIDTFSGFAKSLVLVLPILAICCLVDWVWDIEEETPLPIRFLLTISWGTAFVLAFVAYVITPAVKKFAETETALQIEKTFPILDYRLITVLQLAKPEARLDTKSETLLAELTSEVIECCPKLDFQKSLDLKKLQQASLKFFPLVLVMLGFLVFAGASTTALLARQILLNHSIPRNTVINLPENIILAEGEEATIFFDLVLTKNYKPSKGRVKWISLEGKPLTLPLEIDEEGRWKTTLTSSIEDGTLSVRIGDGRAGPIPVIRKNRPTLEMVSCKILMPEWYGKRPDGSLFEQDFPKGDIESIAGATVVVEFKSSNPLKESLLLIKGNDPTIPPETSLCDNGAGNKNPKIKFTLKQGQSKYQVNCTNQYDLESNPNWQRKIIVLQTPEPLVNLLQEQVPGMPRLTAKDEDNEIDGLPVLIGKQFRVAYRAESLFGISQAVFRYRINEKGDWKALPLEEFKPESKNLGAFLLDNGIFEKSPSTAVIDFYPLPSDDPWKIPDRRTAGGRFEFKIGTLKNLRIGDKIEFFVEATDMNTNSPKTGQSEIFTKEVVGIDELLAWWRRKEKETEKLTQLKNKQAQVFEGFLPNLLPKP